MFAIVMQQVFWKKVTILVYSPLYISVTLTHLNVHHTDYQGLIRIRLRIDTPSSSRDHYLQMKRDYLRAATVVFLRIMISWKFLLSRHYVFPLPARFHVAFAPTRDAVLNMILNKMCARSTAGETPPFFNDKSATQRTPSRYLMDTVAFRQLLPQIAFVCTKSRVLIGAASDFAH